MYLVGPGFFRASQLHRPSFTLALAAFVLATLAWVAPAHAQIAGRTEYTGTESGKIFVEAFTENDATFEKLEVSMINPGPFSFEGVEEGTYTVIAYIDTDDSGSLDADETWVESGQPVSVPPGDQNIVLNLDSPGAGGGDDGGDEDNGCCAVVHQRPTTPAAVLLLIATAMLFRRRRLA